MSRRPERVLEILLAARGHRGTLSTVSPSSCGETSGPRNVAARSRHSSPCSGAIWAHSGDASGPVRWSSPSRRRTTRDRVDGLDLDRLNKLLGTPSRTRADSPRPRLASSRRSSSCAERSSRTSRRQRRNRPCAAAYQGPGGAGLHLDAADAALAELDFAPALAHAEAACDARSLQRASGPPGRCSLCTRSAGRRGPRPLPELPPAARRRARARANRGDARTRSGRHPTGRRPLIAAAADPAGARRDRRAAPFVSSAGQRSRDAHATPSVAPSTETRALVQIEGEAGSGGANARRTAARRALERSRRARGGAPSSNGTCRTCLLRCRASRRARRASNSMAGVSLRWADPAELTLGAQRWEFAEVEVLEALVALVAEHAPLVLLLDDLQSADTQTVAALAYCAAAAAGSPGLRDNRAKRRSAGRPSAAPAQTRPGGAARTALAERARATGMPELHDSTGGNPRFVSDALANGQPATRSQTLAEALLAQCRAEGQLGLPRPRRSLRARAAVRAPVALRSPRRRRSRTHRRA